MCLCLGPWDGPTVVAFSFERGIAGVTTVSASEPGRGWALPPPRLPLRLHLAYRGASLIRKRTPLEDPTVALCLEMNNDPRGVGVSYELLGTPAQGYLAYKKAPPPPRTP